MNEPLPPPSPPPQPAAPQEGSFALGYAGGFGALVAVCILSGVFVAVLPAAAMFFALMPLAAFIGLLVFGLVTKNRTGKGVLAMLLTFVGIVVLLVAACFGYFAIHPLNIH